MKKIIKILLITVGVLCLIDVGIMAVVTNFNSGLIWVGIVGAVFIAYGILFEKINRLRWVPITLAAVAAITLGLCVFLAAYGYSDNVTYREDAVIVLGAGISGETVTYPLAYRLDAAVDYFHKNPAAVIVVSGGQGFQESIPEAEAMRKYLVNKGIPPEKILEENQSTSTLENFRFSKAVLDKYFNRPYTFAVITSDFHVYRATRYAAIEGLACTHLHAKIQWYLIPMSYLRECSAVVKLWIVGS